MRLRVCVSFDLARCGFSGSSSRAPLTKVGNRIWSILLLDSHTVSFLGRHRTIVHDPLTFLCVLHKCPEEKGGGGHFTMGPYCRSFRWWWSRSVVQYVVDTPFFSLCRRTTLDRTHKLIEYSAVGSICVPKLSPSFFERKRHFFCRGRRFGCDWGHLESRLSGRLVSSSSLLGARENGDNNCLVCERIFLGLTQVWRPPLPFYSTLANTYIES